LATEDVAGVHEPAELEGEASAADASAEPVAQMLELRDLVVEILAPCRRQALPVPSSRRAVLGQLVKRFLDTAEGDAHTL